MQIFDKLNISPRVMPDNFTHRGENSVSKVWDDLIQMSTTLENITILLFAHLYKFIRKSLVKDSVDASTSR